MQHFSVRQHSFGHLANNRLISISLGIFRHISIYTDILRNPLSPRNSRITSNHLGIFLVIRDSQFTPSVMFSRFLFSLFLLLFSATSFAAERTFYATYKLHGQTRKFELYFSPKSDGSLNLRWRMERHGHWREGTYSMSSKAIQSADCMNYSQPIDHSNYNLKDNELFMLLSNSCFGAKVFKLNGLDFKETEKSTSETKVFVNEKTGCTIEALKEENFHLIMKMEKNPMNINWSVVKWAPESASLKDELKADPCKTASVYRAYPWLNKEPGLLSATPEGFTAFYISHYGRHGSRWMPDAARYTKLIEIFDSIKQAKPLTPTGEKVYNLLQIAWEDAKDREGSLTSVGAAQHQAIAKRMVSRFPSVFSGGANIEARSSTVMRCAMSMTAFCNALKEANPYLQITTECNERTLKVINNVTAEAKAMSKDASWYNDYLKYCKKVINGDRLCLSLFGENNLTSEEKTAVMTELYWYASDMQDTNLGINLYEFFTDDELYNMWTTINYRMYVCNTWCPLGKGTGPNCAKALLKDFIEKADCKIQQSNMQSGTQSEITSTEQSDTRKFEGLGASLRFGHDTALLRLLALMGIKECSSKEKNPEKFADAWQDFRISPMAANLQMIFYKNNEGTILVKFLLNEEETTLPALTPSIAPAYYKWEDVKTYWGSFL